jgi:hypothetical protein
VIAALGFRADLFAGRQRAVRALHGHEKEGVRGHQGEEPEHEIGVLGVAVKAHEHRGRA